ncbi:ammonium transporter [Patulibacter defluvii]|uniref:ammonium transporter n=1 Tax=Patulibacter defluvii TaxID=3095358 RepID=UPI002A74BBF1|nr:ammonium transporter [Patulibacter sp. DM4]
MSRTLRSRSGAAAPPERSTRAHRAPTRWSLPSRGKLLLAAFTSLLTSAIALPSVSSALYPPEAYKGNTGDGAGQIGGDLLSLVNEVNALWLVLGAALVFFMQVGFLGLEIGFSRGKNVGSGIAKIIVNLAIAAIVWWAVGYGMAFGSDAGRIIGGGDWFYSLDFVEAGKPTPTGGADGFAFFFFQFTFAAVSLAIVWGSTLERIKFVVYPIFAIVFIAVIYPLVAHAGWSGAGIFGGDHGLTIGDAAGALDYAGSGVVHLTGATAALAATLLLGPRRGKYGPDGKPRAIPGHSMPIFGIGVLVLWLGWFGFNGASSLNTDSGFFVHVISVTNLGAAAGVVGAGLMMWLKTRTFDVGMLGNGAIAGLVAITAPAGYVEMWAAPIIGLVAGLIVVFGILFIDRIGIDDPVGATSAHGLAGIWGSLSIGLFLSPDLAKYNALGGNPNGGLFTGGGIDQLIVQALVVLITFAWVFGASFAVFWLIKKTIGIRVSEEKEIAGLDISEHGMYGYPEQFIPEAELVGYTAVAPAPAPLTPSAVKEEVKT